MSKLITITDADFETVVLQSDKAVVVEFGAEWCQPCHAIVPYLEEIAEEMQDQITMCKIGIDQSPEAAITYSVRALPTLMIFKNGEPIAVQTNPTRKSAIKDWIEANI